MIQYDCVLTQKCFATLSINQAYPLQHLLVQNQKWEHQAERRAKFVQS